MSPLFFLSLKTFPHKCLGFLFHPQRSVEYFFFQTLGLGPTVLKEGAATLSLVLLNRLINAGLTTEFLSTMWTVAITLVIKKGSSKFHLIACTSVSLKASEKLILSYLTSHKYKYIHALFLYTHSIVFVHPDNVFGYVTIEYLSM